jgi:hypothetical protein
METITKAPTTRKISMMYMIQDIALDITWSKIAQRYFPEKSVSWMYNKMRGIDGNGGEGHFTPNEQEQLKNALLDFSDRVRNAAHTL